MKRERNILIAFLLNLAFSVFEMLGGIFTGSVAILSDAVHDMGDAVSIGISYFLEKKSKRQPDAIYTYGYGRYSALGGLITTGILLAGSVAVVCNAVSRIFSPARIDYNGMILFAVVGVAVNFCAAFFTRDGASANQKAVNLHMLEDVLSWAVVLVGAIVMRFTEFALLDPILSIAVAVFIFVHGVKNLKEIGDLFLEKAPDNISVEEIKTCVEALAGVQEVHHIHLWSIDGQNCFATMHIVTDAQPQEIKHKIREALEAKGICHVTLETETSREHCHFTHCYKKSRD